MVGPESELKMSVHGSPYVFIVCEMTLRGSGICMHLMKRVLGGTALTV